LSGSKNWQNRPQLTILTIIEGVTMVSMASFASLVSFSLVRWRNRLHAIAPHHVGDFRALNQIHLAFGISFTPVAIGELQPVENVPDPLSVAHQILVVS
jgi:hypothetical protein